MSEEEYHQKNNASNSNSLINIGKKALKTNL